MKLFFDTEFTGLVKNTDLISIGIVSEDGRTFYAELTDFSLDKCDDWIKENVLAHLQLSSVVLPGEAYIAHKRKGVILDTRVDEDYSFEMQGNLHLLATQLTRWLAQFTDVEIWSDCLAYDWVLFNNIFGHAFNIPSNVYYIPFDICTLFKLKGIDPDVSREEFCGLTEGSRKHNALWDATVIKACFEKAIETQE